MELHAWLAATHPELARQFIFVTGGVFTPRARDYLAQAGNLRIEKPFDVKEFKKTVGEYIQRSKRPGPR